MIKLGFKCIHHNSLIFAETNFRKNMVSIIIFIIPLFNLDIVKDEILLKVLIIKYLLFNHGLIEVAVT